MTHECWKKRALWVDLSTGKTWVEGLSGQTLEMFIGGKGLGAYLLYTRVPAGADPLGEENVLFFLTGPLQGLHAPNTGRWTLVTKSPLTGLFLDSHCGGPLGRDIKRAGYDLIAVRGQAKGPVVVTVDDEDVAVREAPDLWGLGVHEVTEQLHGLYGEQASVYAIGPAGENLCRFATGACEVVHQTGRGGAGAVMGAKRLKAVVVHGTSDVRAADPDAIREVNREVARRWREKESGFKDYGTPFLVPVANSLGQFPTRNYETGYFEQHERIGPEAFERWALGTHNSCPQCIMRCTRAYRTEDPDRAGVEVESCIEYESIGLLGGDLGIDDPQALLRLNYLCDKLGLDTISAGGVIGFAMEACSRGIITTEKHGLDIRFGDAEGAEELLRLICRREGIGDLLADGVREAARQLGGAAGEIAVHVKGLEVPAWDPRGRRGMGLSYVTADVGASHLRGWPATTGPPDTSALDVVESMVTARDQKVLTDSLVICHFTYHIPLHHEEKIALLNAATGLEYTQDSVALFAQRVAVLTRMFNHREGVTRASDVLPPRMWEPERGGPRDGMTAAVSRDDFEACLERFYQLRGFDTDGLPTVETIERVGLSDVI